MGYTTRLKDVRRIVDRELARPYVLGKSDCFFMGLAVIDTLTGSQHTEKHLWSYRTFSGAKRALRKVGCETLTEFFDERLAKIETMRCEPGDIVVVNWDGYEHVAVCVGNRFVTKTADGPLMVTVDRVVSAFKV